jgi:hypothetical protein
MDSMDFQTRSEETGMMYHHSFVDAMNAAKKDPTIWKISFSIQTGERIRLVKSMMSNQWIYQPILEKELE